MGTEVQPLGDEDLMAALSRSPDARLFEELVRRHTQKAFSVARAMLKCDAAAEDAVQECFLHVLRACRSYQSGKPFLPWFFAILCNICRDERLRRMKPVPVQPWPSAASHSFRPDTRAETQEQFELAKEAVQALEELDREILRLRIHEDLGFAEIGVICGLSAEAVKKRAYRALNAVRHRLRALPASCPPLTTVK